MNSDIDSALIRIAQAKPHPGLAGLEDRVSLAIGNQPPPHGLAIGVSLGAALFALLLGVASNAVPATEARAASPLAPFGSPGPLAPSSLLLEPR